MGVKLCRRYTIIFFIVCANTFLAIFLFKHNKGIYSKDTELDELNEKNHIVDEKLMKIEGRDGKIDDVIENLAVRFVNLVDVPRSEYTSSSDTSVNYIMGEKNNNNQVSYTINEESMCTDIPSPDLLIYIHSKPEHMIKRLIIRNTWGKQDNLVNGYKIKVVFFIAQSSINDAIFRESKVHNDIIQCPFVDSFRNLTMKSLMSLAWVITYCPHAKFVMKADDDIFVDINSLVETLKSLQKTGKSQKLIMGHLRPQEIPKRGTKRKRGVTLEEYSKAIYPPYCGGLAYVMSSDTVKLLYNQSYNTPLFWLEDVYITGMLTKAAGIRITSFESRYQFIKYEHEFAGVLRKTKAIFFINLSSSSSYDFMTELWYSILNKNNKVKPGSRT